MLRAGVVLGMSGQSRLALLPTGPSVLALVKVFVLRQSGAGDFTRIRRAQTGATEPEPVIPPPA